jgi:hypothetical protein
MLTYMYIRFRFCWRIEVRTPKPWHLGI